MKRRTPRAITPRSIFRGQIMAIDSKIYMHGPLALNHRNASRLHAWLSKWLEATKP